VFVKDADRDILETESAETERRRNLKEANHENAIRRQLESV
jgi:hypothetical protein